MAKHNDRPHPTSVYRYYDEDGVLIYVGITGRGTRRNLEHSDKAAWWPFVARQEVEHYPTRKAALTRERSLIRKYRPPFNTQHNPDHTGIRAAYLRFAEVLPTVDESFQDQYQRLGHGLPLRAVGSSDGTTVTFASHPDHWPVAATVQLTKPAKIRTQDAGMNLGKITEVVHHKAFVLLRGRFTDADAVTDAAVAKLKVISLKRPIAVRVTSVEVESPALTG